MSGRREQNAASGDSRGVRRYAQTRAIQRSAALDRRLRAPVAGAGRDLLLPKPLTGAILASKPRASGECRIYTGLFSSVLAREARGLYLQPHPLNGGGAEMQASYFETGRYHAPSNLPAATADAGRRLRPQSGGIA